jgi:Fe-S-cluster-containing dehydrogenase component
MTEYNPILPREVLDRSFAKQGPKQYTLWMDIEHCVGCHACTSPAAENNTGRRGLCVIEIEEGVSATRKRHPASRHVRAQPHALRPPGLPGGPSVGRLLRKEDGIVPPTRQVHRLPLLPGRPYGAPVQRRGRVMEKCTLCVHRVEKGWCRPVSPPARRGGFRPSERADTRYGKACAQVTTRGWGRYQTQRAVYQVAAAKRHRSGHARRSPAGAGAGGEPAVLPLSQHQVRSARAIVCRFRARFV